MPIRVTVESLNMTFCITSEFARKHKWQNEMKISLQECATVVNKMIELPNDFPFTE